MRNTRGINPKMSENIEVNGENKSKFITATDNFKIEIGTLEYRVHALQTIDPTKAPKYDPKKHKSDVRIEWVDEKKYFGLHMDGLRSAVKYIAVREAGLRVGKKNDDGVSVSLREYLDEIKNVIKEIDMVIKVE
jgi:hypothetical protein